jgi:hypothetical protein
MSEEIRKNLRKNSMSKENDQRREKYALMSKIKEQDRKIKQLQEQLKDITSTSTQHLQNLVIHSHHMETLTTLVSLVNQLGDITSAFQDLLTDHHQERELSMRHYFVRCRNCTG